MIATSIVLVLAAVIIGSFSLLALVSYGFGTDSRPSYGDDHAR